MMNDYNKTYFIDPFANGFGEDQEHALQILQQQQNLNTWPAWANLPIAGSPGVGQPLSPLTMPPPLTKPTYNNVGTALDLSLDVANSNGKSNKSKTDKKVNTIHVENNSDGLRFYFFFRKPKAEVITFILETLNTEYSAAIPLKVHTNGNNNNKNTTEITVSFEHMKDTPTAPTPYNVRDSTWVKVVASVPPTLYTGDRNSTILIEDKFIPEEPWYQGRKSTELKYRKKEDREDINGQDTVTLRLLCRETIQLTATHPKENISNLASSDDPTPLSKRSMVSSNGPIKKLKAAQNKKDTKPSIPIAPNMLDKLAFVKSSTQGGMWLQPNGDYYTQEGTSIVKKDQNSPPFFFSSEQIQKNGLVGRIVNASEPNNYAHGPLLPLLEEDAVRKGESHISSSHAKFSFEYPDRFFICRISPRLHTWVKRPATGECIMLDEGFMWELKKDDVVVFGSLSFTVVGLRSVLVD